MTTPPTNPKNPLRAEFSNLAARLTLADQSAILARLKALHAQQSCPANHPAVRFALVSGLLMFVLLLSLPAVPLTVPLAFTGAIALTLTARSLKTISFALLRG